MGNDLTFGVKLEGNSSTLVSETRAARDEFVALQKQTDALAASNSKMASGYSGLDAAVKQHTAAVKETEGSVNKLLDRYDPLGAKLRQLQADFKALDAAAAGGKIAGRDDARVDQVYARMQAEINAASAAAGNFGHVASASMNKAGLSAGQLRMATQQLPMQFTDIWVSLAAGQNPMTVAMQQGSQIKDSFGGAGSALKAMGGYLMGLINPITVTAAAVAAGGYAWYEYKNHVSNLREELQKLSGDLDLKTNQQLTDRFKELEKAVAEKRAQASSGGWGWRQEAEDAGVLEEELRRVGKQIDANRRLEERLGDIGGEASKLARESTTARGRELERQIKLLQVYHDKQVAGSNTEIDSSSKLVELKKKLADINSPKNTKRDERIDGMQVLKSLEREYQSELAKRGDALNAPLLSESERQLQEDLRGVGTRAQSARVQLEQMYAGGKLPQQEYQSRLKDIQAAEEAQAGAVRVLRDEQDKLNGSWQYGAQIAMRKYLDEVGNVSRQSEALFTKTFKGMEDGLVQFVQKGKVDFASLRDSIVADMIRIQIQQSITGPLMQWGQSALPSLLKMFTGGASAPTTPTTLYAANGHAFTGNGIHAFANGGTFTNQLFNTPTPFKFAAGGGSSQIIVQQPITIDARGADAGVEQRIRALMPAFLAENKRQIVATVQQAVAAKGKTL